MRIRAGIIGAGNLAWHLAPALETAGLRIDRVYSRNPEKARELAARLYDARPASEPDFRQSPAQIIFLAVKDDALPEVIDNLQITPGTILVHTSGSVPLSVFGGRPDCGVFYPLQTFSRDKKVSFENVPFCLEAGDENTLDFLGDIACKISEEVFRIDSEERRKLHLAAVFVCNFTNHLLAEAAEILGPDGPDLKMLSPLLHETVDKAFHFPPKSVQTGPAVRNDLKTMQMHLTMLEKKPRAQAIYRLMSRSVAELHGIKPAEDEF